jgi:hypothetical protein
MIPSVLFSKLQASAGTVIPGDEGIVAIIAPSVAGAQNAPSMFLGTGAAQTAFSEGPLVEFACGFMQVARNPTLCIRPTTSTAATYGTVLKTIVGTASAPTVAGSGLSDDYNVLVQWTVGGTLGTAGAFYQISLDGGALFSAPTALGTALTITPTVPVTNVATGMTITLGTSTETIVAGDQFSFTCTGPRMTTADLTASLTTLYNTKLPWDLLLIHGETSASFISLIDTWVTSLETIGEFTLAFGNTLGKQIIDGSHSTAQTEAAYATALAAVVGSSSTINMSVGADGGFYVSPISGVTKRMPTSFYAVTRSEQYPVGVDPAEIDNGPLPNCQIDNSQSNPILHDELLFPGLDALRLTSLRSVAGENGVFVCNSNILSTPGSDFTYTQYGRCMNAGCRIAFAMLTLFLSRGVRQNLATGFIVEVQRAKWQSTIQAAINTALEGQVSGSQFLISATDPLVGNGPQTISCTFQIVGLKYVKTFSVVCGFVNTLQPQAA